MTSGLGWLLLKVVLVQHVGSSGGNSDRCNSASGQCQQSGHDDFSTPPGSALLQTNKQVRQATERTDPLAFITDVNLHRSELAPARLGSQYANSEKQVQKIDEEGVIAVVPGLGSVERALQVQKNVAWLKQQGVPFECLIFVYRTEQELPLTEFNFEPCQLIRHPGFWMSHVLAMPLNITTKPWILHMMDGIEPQSSVSLKMMFRTMLLNELGHAAPTFDIAPVTSYDIMRRHAEFPIGRVVDFIEMHFDVFTRKYFSCLQDVVDIHNTLGWGVDRLLPSLCGGSIGTPKVNAGSLGLLDQMTMRKAFVERSYAFDAAAKQMNDFFALYPEAAETTYSMIRELQAPNHTGILALG